MWQAYRRQLVESARAWQQDNAFRMAAALAYYSVFSLIPLLLLGIGAVDAFLGEQVASGEFQGQLQEIAGREPGGPVAGSRDLSVGPARAVRDAAALSPS